MSWLAYALAAVAVMLVVAIATGKYLKARG